MKSFSVRLSESEIAAFRTYAESQKLPFGTALKQLAKAGLQAQRPPPPSLRPLLEQCLNLLRLQSLYQLHQHHRGWLQDETIPSKKRAWNEAAVKANQSLDRDPELFGRVRFTVAETVKPAGK